MTSLKRTGLCPLQSRQSTHSLEAWEQAETSGLSGGGKLRVQVAGSVLAGMGAPTIVLLEATSQAARCAGGGKMGKNGGFVGLQKNR